MPGPFVYPVDGPPVTARSVRDVMGDAFLAGADTVIVPVDRLDPAFFDLATGVAGDIVQAFVNYRMRLVVVGALPPAAAASRAFAAFVREGNRGSHPWFVETMDEAEARLGEGR